MDKLLIKQLKQEVDFKRRYKEPTERTSWMLGHGIIITVEDAELFIKLLERQEDTEQQRRLDIIVDKLIKKTYH